MTAAATAIEHNDYNGSAQILTNARDLAEKVNNKNRIGLTSNTLSRLYFQTNNLKKAREENTIAINIQEEIKDQEGLSQSYITAAKIEKQAKKLSKSISLFNSS